MSENQTGERKEGKCNHEWKAKELAHDKSHVQLVCVKCGATKEIELFP
ncbi:MAG: hypothetical protein ACPLZC_06395 [Candidatus Bathyarchaeales archaeon]